MGGRGGEDRQTESVLSFGIWMYGGGGGGGA